MSLPPKVEQMMDNGVRLFVTYRANNLVEMRVGSRSLDLQYDRKDIKELRKFLKEIQKTMIEDNLP